MCKNLVDIEYLSVFEWLSREASALQHQFPTSENEASPFKRQSNEEDPLLKLHHFFSKYRCYNVDQTDFHLFFWRLDPTFCQLALLNGEIIGKHGFPILLSIRFRIYPHVRPFSSLARNTVSQGRLASTSSTTQSRTRGCAISSCARISAGKASDGNCGVVSGRRSDSHPLRRPTLTQPSQLNRSNAECAQSVSAPTLRTRCWDFMIATAFDSGAI